MSKHDSASPPYGPTPKPAQRLSAKQSLQLLAVFGGVMGVFLGGKGLSGLATGEITFHLKSRGPHSIHRNDRGKDRNQPVTVSGPKTDYAGLSLLALGTSVTLIGVLFWFTAESG